MPNLDKGVPNSMVDTNDTTKQEMADDFTMETSMSDEPLLDTDADMEDMILPYLGDEYADYLYGGSLYLDGTDFYDIGQTYYGFAYGVDATGEIDVDTLLGTDDVADLADGFYDFQPVYLFSF